MATKVTSQTAGSWFPSGYYGHYRSRVRVDFNNEYRQLSKPQPPGRFMHRSTEPASAHQFSRHDNRHSFMNDASYFAQGLGKKRHPERSGLFDPGFIAWVPKKGKNPKDGRPMTSTYRQDFQIEQPYAQLLTQRPKTSFDQFHTTTYRTSHGCDSPNRDFINAMNNEALMLSGQSRLRAAKLKKSRGRETVATCLSWYRPRVPAATQLTDYSDVDTKPVEISSEKNGCAEQMPPAMSSQQPAVESQPSCPPPQSSPPMPVVVVAAAE